MERVGDPGRTGAGSAVHRTLGRALEAAVLALMAALAVVVVVGVLYRKFGASLVWYDEIASILLAWLTYYGAALAALRRAHIGVPTVVDSLRGSARTVVVLAAETFIILFFIAVAWAGWQVIQVLGSTPLVSLPSVPASIARSVIPIGAVLFVAAEIATIPDALRPPDRASEPNDVGASALPSEDASAGDDPRLREGSDRPPSEPEDLS
ncbi:MAG: TRAP transporter small permease subunit [Gemmatimonadetes bacterium]|nr:TRAP transporter small permease subunit [Gemmatimonadota bacterium]